MGRRRITLLAGALLALGLPSPAGALPLFSKFKAYAPPSFGTGQERECLSTLAVGDLNRDGHQDLACFATESVTQWVATLLGAGDGTFTAGPVAQVTDREDVREAVPDIAEGDLDHDGQPDIVGSNGASLWIVFRNADGSFAPFAGLKLNDVWQHRADVRVADVTADGNLDIVLTTYEQHALVLMKGNGDRSFHSPVTIALGEHEYPEDLEIADVNADSHPDLLVATSRDDGLTAAMGVDVLLGNGDGTFGAPVGAALHHSSAELAVADFDLDGKLDVYSADFSGASAGDFFLHGNGDGTFAASAARWIGGSYALDAADVTLDGRPDLITAAYDNEFGFRVALGNGQGMFPGEWTPGDVDEGPTPADVATGDFNQDGRPDLVGVVDDGVRRGKFVVFLNRRPRRFELTGAVPQRDYTMIITAHAPAAGRIAVRLTRTLTVRRKHRRVKVVRTIGTARTSSTAAGDLVLTLTPTTAGRKLITPYSKSDPEVFLDLRATFTSSAGAKAKDKWALAVPVPVAAIAARRTP